MLRLSLLLACLVGFWFIHPMPAAAQDGPDEAERLRTLVKLMSDWTWYGREAELLEGRLPSEVPDGFPTELEVLGSLAHQEGFVAFLTSPQEPGESKKRVTSALVSAGWTEQEDNLQSTVGFVVEIPSRPIFFCRNRRESLVIGCRDRPEGGSALRLEYSDSSRMCDPTLMRGMRPQDLPVPPLTPPDDATMTDQPGMSMSHMAGRGETHRWIFESATTLETAMSPPALIDHYGLLFEAHGWTSGTRLKSEEIGIGQWAYENERGEWRALLFALPDGDGYELLLRVDGLPESEIPTERRAD